MSYYPNILICADIVMTSTEMKLHLYTIIQNFVTYRENAYRYVTMLQYTQKRNNWMLISLCVRSKESL